MESEGRHQPLSKDRKTTIKQEGFHLWRGSMAKKKPLREETKPDGEEISPSPATTPVAKAVEKVVEVPKTAKEQKALKGQKASKESKPSKESKATKEPVVTPVPVVAPVAEVVEIVKKKRPRFVREKKEQKTQTETTQLTPTPRSTTLAGKIMSKNIVPLPKEESDIWPKGKRRQ
jgi:hypothetical protein